MKVKVFFRRSEHTKYSCVLTNSERKKTHHFMRNVSEQVLKKVNLSENNKRVVVLLLSEAALTSW